MEINKLYVLEWNGKKHYFTKSCDRSYFWNCHQFTYLDDVKQYEISIEDIEIKKN